MATTSSARTFTVRFPADLHRAASEAAAERRVSLNLLLQELAADYLKQQEERRLFDSFTRLGEDLEECDVEYAWDAQRDAIDHAAIQV